MSNKKIIPILPILRRETTEEDDAKLIRQENTIIEREARLLRLEQDIEVRATQLSAVQNDLKTAQQDLAERDENIRTLTLENTRRAEEIEQLKREGARADDLHIILTKVLNTSLWLLIAVFFITFGILIASGLGYLEIEPETEAGLPTAIISEVVGVLVVSIPNLIQSIRRPVR